jgi:putative Holliday junction resolvase
VLAIDPGSKRIGLAVSDPLGLIAQPLTQIPAEPAETLSSRLAKLARELEAESMVVGLPRRMDGSSGPEARAARELAARLREDTGLAVTLVDERLTSVAAEKALLAAGHRRSRRRDLADAVAAALILQTYLESRGRPG